MIWTACMITISKELTKQTLHLVRWGILEMSQIEYFHLLKCSFFVNVIKSLVKINEINSVLFQVGPICRVPLSYHRLRSDTQEPLVRQNCVSGQRYPITGYMWITMWFQFLWDKSYAYITRDPKFYRYLYKAMYEMNKMTWHFHNFLTNYQDKPYFLLWPRST